MTIRRRCWWALVVLAFAVVACGDDAVSPQPCEQELATSSFRVCLPVDATLDEPTEEFAGATVGNYHVFLRERPAQHGDADQAAHATLATLQEQVGSFYQAASTSPIALDNEGPIEVDGAQGAFESLTAGYDMGEVDDLLSWGRALTVDDTTGAVLVVRHFDDVEERVSEQQVTEGQEDAMPVIVTLTPRG